MTTEWAVASETALLIWRDGFLPLWESERLQRLLTALEANDPKLATDYATHPPAYQRYFKCKVECCCPVAFCSVDDPFNATVGEVENGFVDYCRLASIALGDLSIVRLLFSWMMDNSRETVFSALAAEVRDELRRRTVQ